MKKDDAGRRRAPASVRATTDAEAIALERPRLLPLRAEEEREAVELLAQLFAEAARKRRPGALDGASGVVIDGAFPSAPPARDAGADGVAAPDRAA